MAGLWHDAFEEVDRRIAGALTRIGVTGTTLDAGTIGGAIPPDVLPDLAGDVTGPPGSNTVEAIQGVAVDPTPPTAGQVITAIDADSAEWADPASATPLTVQEVDGSPTETPTTTIEFPNGTLTEPSTGVVRYTPASAASLTVQEVDGSPTETPTTTLEFPNGTLTEPSTGVVRYTPSAGASLTVKEIDGTPTATSVSIIQVSNGKLTDNGGGDVTLDISGTSVIYTNAAASPPSAPNDGDFWFPSDGFGLTYFRASGAWVGFGPVSILTNPNLIAMTWTNQGTANVFGSDAGLFLSATAVAPTQMRIRKWTAPSTPYTYTFYVQPLQHPGATVDLGHCGVGFRQSSDGKLHTLSLRPKRSTVGSLTSSKWTNETTFSAHYSSTTDAGAPMPNWLRISDNGTNRICDWSFDGQAWGNFHSIGRTDFLTADQVFIYAHAPSTSFPMEMVVLSIALS